MGHDTRLAPEPNLLDGANLLTIRDAAALIHVHRSTLRRWDKSGLLVPYRVGSRGDRRYTQAQLLSILQDGRREVGRTNPPTGAQD